MKTRQILSLIFLIALAFTSCKKKDYPQNVVQDPTFYVSASINGVPVSMNAGQNGYYMYSSHKQDSNNLYAFIAELKPENCTNICANSLKFEVYDNQQSSAGGASNISSSIKVSDYNFANNTPVTPSLTGYAVSFRSIFNKTATAYNWSFGDGGTSTDANPTHIYSSAGIYNTCLDMNDGSTVSGICNPIKVTISPVACQSRILINSVNGNSIAFSQQTSGTSPFQFKWNFGDGIESTDANPVHTYSTSGMYMTSLRVKDASGDSTLYHYNINTAQSSVAAPNYSISSVTAIYSNSITALFSKVKITYTNPNGVVYSSFTQPQSAGSANFSIVSVEDFKKNERNELTKKVRINFNCKLYNGSDVVEITNGQAVLAVSYK
jgi:PKD repeat protein